MNKCILTIATAVALTAVVVLPAKADTVSQNIVGYVGDKAGEVREGKIVPIDPMAEYGGSLVRPAKGYVAFCDYQKKIAKEDMLGFFVASKECPVPVTYKHVPQTGAFSFANAKKAMGDANAAIFVVDDPSLPMTLLAREEKWGLVNVAALAADKPKTLTLLSRANKLTTRLITDILGGNNCLQVNFSAMKPVYSLKDLDAMEGHAIAPMSLTQMMYSLPKLGLSPVMMTTYQDACAEGWAPAPTNDIQRTIWNEVKNPETRFKKDLPDLKKNK